MAMNEKDNNKSKLVNLTFHKLEVNSCNTSIVTGKILATLWLHIYNETQLECDKGLETRLC